MLPPGRDARPGGATQISFMPVGKRSERIALNVQPQHVDVIVRDNPAAVTRRRRLTLRDRQPKTLIRGEDVEPVLRVWAVAVAEPERTRIAWPEPPPHAEDW